MKRQAFLPAAPAALEARVVPSHAPLARPGAIQVEAAPGSAALLIGGFQGTEVPRPGRAGELRLAGRGDIAVPGVTSGPVAVRASGVLQEGADGQVTTATLTLRAARGTLTLRLQRDPNAASGAGTTYLLDSFGGGTGLFRGVRGSRFAQLLQLPLTATPARRVFRLDLANDPPPPAPPPVTIDTPPDNPTQVLALSGSVGGAAGSLRDLGGGGSVTPLGDVQVTASIVYGDDPLPSVNGTMILTNPSGSLVLHFGRDPASPTGPWRYDIVGGTGAYAGAVGSGPMVSESGTISSTPPGPDGATIRFPFAFTFGGAPGPVLIL